VHIPVTSVPASANAENILKSIFAFFGDGSLKFISWGLCSVHPARKLNHKGWDGRNVEHPWIEINLRTEFWYRNSVE